MPEVSTTLMPAEWSPHQATWVSWPRNADTWPGLLDAARAAMADLIAALALHERVFINVFDADEARDVERRLDGRVPADRLGIVTIATDDAWIRDYGAILVSDSDGRTVATDFDYNAWGEKYLPCDRDRRVARQMAARLGVEYRSVPVVLEGGSVDVNGAGLGLVTEQCLLNVNRNPMLTQADIERVLNEVLGIDQPVWLGHGVIGDDTDGHVDNLARFISEDRVIAAVAPDRADPNHAALADNLERLRQFRDESGRSLEVVELPLPPPLFADGVRLPASYANFYIANGIVLCPSFGTDSDAAAQSILAACFSGREIVAIDCRALIVGLGALHCLTQQIPVIVAGPD